MNTAISEYEIFVEEIKELIHKKQYHTLRMLNSETINLYWEIGKETVSYTHLLMMNGYQEYLKITENGKKKGEICHAEVCV